MNDKPLSSIDAAIQRLTAAAVRARLEEPQLAAPDGTVEVAWRDLALVLSSIGDEAPPVLPMSLPLDSGPLNASRAERLFGGQ